MGSNAFYVCTTSSKSRWGAPEVVLTPSIFAKDTLVRLKKRRLGPIIDLMVGRRKLAKARSVEVEEGGDEDTPRTTKGRRHLPFGRGSSVCPEESKGMFAKF